MLLCLHGLYLVHKSRNHMNEKLYNARQTELKPADAAILWRFTQAYRPHDAAPTWQELKASGLERIEEDSLMDVIRDEFESEMGTVSPTA